MEMGQKIHELRIQRGLTLEELGNIVGVGKSTVRKWENGIIANMRRDKILKVSEALGVSPAYLMGWTEIAEQLKPTKKELELFYQDLYEERVVKEMRKMNQKGKVKLLDTAREMTCSPLYNPNYQVEVAAAHERTDIEVTEEMRQHDDALMDDDNNWE